MGYKMGLGGQHCMPTVSHCFSISAYGFHPIVGLYNVPANNSTPLQPSPRKHILLLKSGFQLLWATVAIMRPARGCTRWKHTPKMFARFGREAATLPWAAQMRCFSAYANSLFTSFFPHKRRLTLLLSHFEVLSPKEGGQGINGRLV
eukprot:12169-Chlamydomonas_euryale.AAC.7